MESSLKKSFNRFSCVGIVYENNLKKEDCDIKIKDNGAVVNTIKGEKISGTVLVATDDGTFVFRVYCQNPTSTGKDNPMWENHLEMLTLVPQINSKVEGEPSLVQVSGTIDVNDYYSERTQKVTNNIQWRANAISTKIKPDEVSGCRLDITGFLQKMSHETKNDEETGRLKMTVLYVERDGSVKPIELFVEENLADEVEDYYNVGDTVDLTLERRITSIGRLQKRKGGPGSNKTLPSSGGYSNLDQLFYNEGDIIEEPDELTTTDDDGNEVEVETDWLNPKAIKKALQIRQEKLDKILSDGKAGKNKKKEEKKSTNRTAPSSNKRLQKNRDMSDFNDDDEDTSPEVENEDDDDDF